MKSLIKKANPARKTQLFNGVKDELGETVWYKQGAAVKPLYASYPYYACSEFKIFGRKIKPKYEVVIFLSNNFMEDYISQRSLKKAALYYYERQEKDKKFIYKLFRNWQDRFVSSFLKIVNNLTEKNFAGFGDKKLFFLFNNFTKIYLAVWQESIFLDSFDYYGEKILARALKKEKKEIGGKDLEILLSPPKPSFLQKERLDLLEIAEKILRNKEALRFILKIKNYKPAAKKFPWLAEALDKHSGEYHWLHNDFSGVEYLGPQYFFKGLALLLGSKKRIREEKEMRNYLRKLSQKKAEIIKKYKISEKLANTINFLAFLGNFRDERKTYNQIAGAVLKKFAQEFSRRSGLGMEIVENLFHWETNPIRKIRFSNGARNILNLPPAIKEKAKERPKGSFYILRAPQTYTDFFGKEAEELGSYLKDLVAKAGNLRGSPAYPGVVRGIAKIIKDKNDFSKMRKGDILIAPNTRPEYVPIMKIAGAIVSEEGGITCHSAIVARELKIPCVVGVQGVISALKDGDGVEVDANKGVIRKI